MRALQADPVLSRTVVLPRRALNQLTQPLACVNHLQCLASLRGTAHLVTLPAPGCVPHSVCVRRLKQNICNQSRPQACHSTACPPTQLLPDAKVPEHDVQQLLHIHVAGDNAEVVGSNAQLLSCHVHLRSHTHNPRRSRTSRRTCGRVSVCKCERVLACACERVSVCMCRLSWRRKLSDGVVFATGQQTYPHLGSRQWTHNTLPSAVGHKASQVLTHSQGCLLASPSQPMPTPPPPSLHHVE